MERAENTGNVQNNMDVRINAAMEKIIQDTIGDIPVVERPEWQTPPEKKKIQMPKPAFWGKNKKQDNMNSAGSTGNDDDTQEGSENKKRVKRKVLTSAIGAVAVIGIGVYGYFTYYYSDKFFPNTTINNIECAEMTAKQAEALIRKKVEDYQIKLTFRGDVSDVLDGKDMSYAYVSDGQVTKIQKAQTPLLWISGLFTHKKYNVAENIDFDEDELNDQLMQLDSMKTENMTPPVNAYYGFIDGKYQIVPEEEGNTIDVDAMKAAVKEAVSESQTEFSVEDSGVYVQPEIRSTSEALNAEVDELNSLMTASITYTLPTGEEVLDGNQLRDWLVKDENGHYVKDEGTIREKAREYVSDLADRVNTVGAERAITTTSGVETTVSGGDYGWDIDEYSEIEALVSNIMNNEQIAREPEYSQRERGTANSGLGDTYIEVNLTEQTMYYYQDGDIIFSAEFVSGRMTSSRMTPSGVYTLTYKETDRILRGAVQSDGSYSYESHVNFWMPFNGGVGFHDASWRSSFGGDIYIDSGSHGCINMDYSDAKTLYSLIDYNVPIVCFYY